VVPNSFPIFLPFSSPLTSHLIFFYFSCFFPQLGFTSFALAASAEQVKVMKLLLDSGADIDAADMVCAILTVGEVWCGAIASVCALLWCLSMCHCGADKLFNLELHSQRDRIAFTLRKKK
jgi:hypothetical protein